MYAKYAPEYEKCIKKINWETRSVDIAWETADLRVGKVILPKRILNKNSERT